MQCSSSSISAQRKRVHAVSFLITKKKKKKTEVLTQSPGHNNNLGQIFASIHVPNWQHPQGINQHFLLKCKVSYSIEMMIKRYPTASLEDVNIGLMNIRRESDKDTRIRRYQNDKIRLKQKFASCYHQTRRYNQTHHYHQARATISKDYQSSPRSLHPPKNNFAYQYMPCQDILFGYSL